MKKYLKNVLAIACVLSAALGAAPLTACSSPVEQYNVVYNLNYDGAEVESRTVGVPNGGKAVSWEPYREGYELADWYMDADYSRKFNFRQTLSSDVTLYAKWNKVDHVSVTYDENYAGKHKDTVVQNRKGSAVDEVAAPVPSRLGFVFTGWYKDSACTQKWDFVSDTADGDTTLYAGYRRDNSMKLDKDGKPVFENVNVNVWLGVDYDGYMFNNVMWNLAKAFNRDPQYRGKIKVNPTYDLIDHDTFSLRIQKTANKNETDKNYYSLDEIYSLAGIEYSADDWYADAVRDSSVEGRLCSVPIVAGVPFIIYNKALMNKYNGDKPLPQNYSEYGELLQKVYSGESEANPDFKSIVCGSSATWTEVSSLGAFVQNGVDYFDYQDGTVRNTWDDEESIASAAAALKNTYDLLGNKGKYHGMLGVDDAQDGEIRSRVERGTAFMGIISWPTPVIDICDNDAFGVMPLSGLYANGEYKDRIPVCSIGLGFYRSQSLTNTELAAAGVFADYVSKHSLDFALNGWYPVRKSVAESAEFVDSDNSKFKLLNKVGDPENFYTMCGYTKTIHVATDIAANGYLSPALRGDTALTVADFTEMARRLRTSIIED